MSDTEQYVEKIARAWHKHIQEINREWGFYGSEIQVSWEDETENGRRDICNCIQRIIDDGLIPASEDWEWEAMLKRIAETVVGMTPEEHERTLKAMGMQEIKTAYGTFCIIPHPLLEEKDE